MSKAAIGRERREAIVAALAEDGRATAGELAAALELPTKTVEKPLTHLLRAGRVEIVGHVGRGGHRVYALAGTQPAEPADAHSPAASGADKPSPSRELAPREPEPAPVPELERLPLPPPFAGGELPLIAQNGNLAETAVIRYAHTLMDRLDKLDVPHTAAPGLMDRIERTLGLVDGRAEQAQLAAGDGEPG